MLDVSLALELSLAPKVCENRSFSSLPWLEVRVPEETCASMRLEIFDCSSSGDGGVDEELVLEVLDVEDVDEVEDVDSEESIDVSALDSAVASVEEIEPDETSD